MNRSNGAFVEPPPQPRWSDVDLSGTPEAKRRLEQVFDDYVREYTEYSRRQFALLLEDEV